MKINGVLRDKTFVSQSIGILHLPLGENNRKLSPLIGSLAVVPFKFGFSRTIRCHSLFNHFRMCRATTLGLCIRSESMKIIHDKGSSLVRSRLSPSIIAPALTMIQRDQCMSLLMGMNISRFSKILMFFLRVQDATASGPPDESAVKKCDVKKWNFESSAVSSREILPIKPTKLPRARKTVRRIQKQLLRRKNIKHTTASKSLPKNR